MDQQECVEGFPAKNVIKKFASSFPPHCLFTTPSEERNKNRKPVDRTLGFIRVTAIQRRRKQPPVESSYTGLSVKTNEDR